MSLEAGAGFRECLRMARYSDGAQRKCLPDVPVEQMDVGGERKRGGVVAEPALDLDHVAILRKQHRGARMPEGVEPDPGQARLLAGGLEHAAKDIAGHERRAIARREHGIFLPTPLCFPTTLPERQHERVVQRNFPATVATLGRSHAALDECPTTLTCGVEPSSCRCLHWSAMASLIRRPVAARNQKNRRHCSGRSPSSVDSSAALIVRASSSSAPSAVGRCGRSTSRAGFERIRPSRTAVVRHARSGAMMFLTVASDSTRPCICSSHSHAMNPATFDGVTSVSRVRWGKCVSTYCLSCRR
jgi:hypothetical protein